MLWLALHCPGLPLAVCVDPASPVTVSVETGRRHERIVAAGRKAEAAGVRPGMELAAARALCPDLVVRGRDRVAEDLTLQRLAEGGLAFTDHVAPEPPFGLLLEVGRSRRLFGGLDALLGAVDEWLAQSCSQPVRRGIAPTPAGARLLARAGGAREGVNRVETVAALADALASLPVALLAPDSETARRLTGWGIESLGDCVRLPRAGLARRLGPAFVDRLDRVTGRQAESVPRFAPPQQFHARLALPQASAAMAMILTAVEMLCSDLAQWLRARDAAIQAFHLHLHPQRGPSVVVGVGLVVPGREAGHLLALARERLERTELPAEVAAVGLESEPPVAYAPPAGDLWLDAAGEPPERLLERLRARLGRSAVRGLTLRADHRPERAWAWSEPGQPPGQESASPPTRPLWLLQEPAPLATGEDRRPRLAGPLALVSGPERIETGWWDGDDVERDYFIARSRIGLVLWIYRERRTPGRWFVHGLFG